MNSSYTDIHVHAVPRVGYTEHGLRERAIFRLLRQAGGLTPAQDDPATAYMAILEKRLRASRFVGRAVLLALDAAHDNHGRLDTRHIGFSVPNDDVVAYCQQQPDIFLFGASVHPHRPDALEELARCKALGAVLIKWLPNSQNIDPADRRHIPFYRKLVELRLPLLCHTGIEVVLSITRQSLGTISRLRLPLDMGVTVIAAHGGSSGLVWNHRTQREYVAMLRTYPHFYGDTAGLGFPNRMGALLWWRDRPDLWDRLLFGTDYPVPFYAPLWRPFLTNETYAALAAEHNPFDRMALLLEGLGLRLKPESFTRMLEG